MYTRQLFLTLLLLIGSLSGGLAQITTSSKQIDLSKAGAGGQTTTGALPLTGGALFGPLAVPTLTSRVANSVFSAVQSQSGTNTRDGLSRIFSDSLCNTINSAGVYNGCRVVIESNYPFDADRMYFNPAIQAQPSSVLHPGAHIVDNRGGGEHHVVVDATVGEYYQGPHPWSLDCFMHYSFSQANCMEMNIVDSYPGFSNGNVAVGPQGWAGSHGFGIFLKAYGAGIHAAQEYKFQKTGIGDVHGWYGYITGQGGFRAASDEMLELTAANGGEEPGPAYTANVLTVTGTSITALATKGQLLQGVGRMMINRTPITSGCATAKTQMMDDAAHALPVSVYTLGCGANIPTNKVATAWGLLDQNITPANLQYVSSSPTSQMTDSISFSAHSLHGHPVAGQLACFAGQFHESATVTAVNTGGGTSGDDLITVNLHRAHNLGSLVMFSAGGCMGFEEKANTAGDPDNSDGLRYILDTIGAMDAHTIAVVRFAGGQSNLVDDREADFSFQGTIAPLSNTGGVVRIPLLDTYFNQWRFQNLPIITISNSDVAAFNTQCTNVTYGNNGDTGPNLYCTQASSTGLSSSTANATISAGDTGYGTTRFNLFSSAEVWDVQNYAGTIALAPSGYSTDTFRFEPNGLGLAPGILIEEPHDYAAGYIGQHMYLNWNNNYASEYSNIRDEGIGPNATDLNYAYRLTNYSPPSFYGGLGGHARPPHGFWTKGISTDHGGMEVMPWPAGSSYDIVTGCPPTALGCADPFYYFNMFAAQGNGDYLRLKYIPATNTVRNEALHNQFPRAPSSISGNLTYACFDMANGQELTRSTLPCVPASSTSIANIVIMLPVSKITAGTCTVTATVSMPGVTSSSAMLSSFVGDPTSVTGYGSTAGLGFWPWFTTNTLNWKVCNPGTTDITPGALSMNVGAR